MCTEFIIQCSSARWSHRLNEDLIISAGGKNTEMEIPLFWTPIFLTCLQVRMPFFS